MNIFAEFLGEKLYKNRNEFVRNLSIRPKMRWKIPTIICMYHSKTSTDKVLYEEIMTNDDNLESNLLSSSLLKIHVVCTNLARDSK